MKSAYPVNLAVIAALAACTGGNVPTADEAMESRALPADADIISRTYDAGYTVPDGFYVDDRASTPRSFTLYHVKDASVSYELCTDDFYEALAWEQADNGSRAVQGYFVGFLENDRYFEFVRELSYDGGSVESTSPGFARVFKCSNVNRNGVDRLLRSGFAGVLNARPLSAELTRQFTEYMWQFAFFNVSRRKVLLSLPSESLQAFHHTLVLALAVSQGADQCDRIELAEWTFSVDRQSGAISKSYRPVRTLRARLANGGPEAC